MGRERDHPDDHADHEERLARDEPIDAHNHTQSPAFMWTWIVIEIVNGIGHPAWSIMQGGYTPGVATAPVLLVLALYLARQLL